MSQEGALGFNFKDKDILSDCRGSALDLLSLNMGGPDESASSLGGLAPHLSTPHITRSFGMNILPDNDPRADLFSDYQGWANQG